MKAVLLSVKPKYCELIANGKKTVEVRKNRPKIDVPFKLYMYCTGSDIHSALVVSSAGTTLFSCCDYRSAIPCGGEIGNGKVIGEFICDCCEEYWFTQKDVDIEEYEDVQLSCLTSKAVKECEYRERVYTNPDYTNGVCLPGSYICTKESKTDWCGKCRIKPLVRPPQSWCYVEERYGATTKTITKDGEK